MFSAIVTIILTVIVFIAILINYVKNKEFNKLVSRFTGPLSLPIIGCAHLFLGNTEDIYRRFLKLCQKFPSPFRIWLGNRLIILCYDPEEAKTILLSPKTLDKDDLYNVAIPWMGSGLLIAPANIWRPHRKLIQPAFTKKVLQSFVETFQKHAIELTKDLEIEVDKKEFGVSNYISLHTLNIICETAMGINVLSDKKTSKIYLEAIERTFKVMIARVFNFWLHWEIIFKYSKLSEEFQASVNYLHKFTDDVIRNKRRKLENIENKEEFSDEIVDQKKPFLDLLMELSDTQNKLSDVQLRNEVDTFLFGGHDTTATTVSYVMLMLASFPEIQDKAYEEIYSIYGAEDAEEVPVKPEDLQYLVYLEKVIKETLRLFPVAPILLRKVKENLPIGQHTLPKGSAALIVVLQVHRDEKNWPQPLEFNPERFSPEETAKRHPYSYLPFSAGPRNCIGVTYSIMSMKVLVSTILRKYVLIKDKFKPIEDIRVKLDIMLRPAEPVTVRIEKRIPKKTCR